MCAFSSTQSLPLYRKFHSHDHPPPPGPYNETESLILSHALPHIPSHGFTSTSLALGAKDAGYIDASVNLFPKGAVTLVGYYLWTQRMGLSARTKAVFEAGEAGGGGRELEVREKVKLLTWERLSANKEVIHRWQEVRHPLVSFSTRLNKLPLYLYRN
jgi:ubiquinone biosynthesis protein COQ9